jgi:hypothetical protein
MSRAAALAVLLLPAVAARADTLTVSGEVKQGWVIRASADGWWLMDERGAVSEFPAAETRAAIDFGAVGRLAQVNWRDGHGQYARLTSWGGEKFCGTDKTAEPVEFKLANVGEVRLYPLSHGRRHLALPHVAQRPDYCGEACLEMLTAWLGARTTQDEAHALEGLPEARGAESDDLDRLLPKLGLPVTMPRWFPREPARDCPSEPKEVLGDTMRILHTVSRGAPALLGVWLDAGRTQSPGETWFDHFVLAVGYDLPEQRLILADPSEDEERAVTFEQLADMRANEHNCYYALRFRLRRTWQPVGGAPLAAEYVGWRGGQVCLLDAGRQVQTFRLDHLAASDREILAPLRPGNPPGVEDGVELPWAAR